MAAKPANFTRRTADLVGRFRRNGQWHLVALHSLLNLSDFGREGIARSGSYRFADHLYRNEASGRGWLGRWLDRRLLELPASRAMRRRYLKAKEALALELGARGGDVRVLAVPCGIPRDLGDLAVGDPAAARRIHYTGMDLDPEVINAAKRYLAGEVPGPVAWVEGNALERSAYPVQPFDFVISTGLGEFLDDDQLAVFYRNVFETMADGGVFFTSATAFERRSHFLMKTFELEAHYRDEAHLGSILRLLPWRDVMLEVDSSGLQTFARAVK